MMFSVNASAGTFKEVAIIQINGKIMQMLPTPNRIYLKALFRVPPSSSILNSLSAFAEADGTRVSLSH
jgi:hypothetical protein